MDYCIAEQATDDHVAHVLCMLDKEGYKHTVRICFSTTKIVTRKLRMLIYTYIACIFVLVSFFYNNRTNILSRIEDLVLLSQRNEASQSSE